jgi:DNA topoisomerase-1
MATAEIRLTRNKLKRLVYDTVKTAEAVNLIYTNDSEPGIYRLKDGDEFVYFKNKKKLTDKDELLRIKRLAIPPAWDKVWISALENGHLQATGFDQLGRKQYKYHPLWHSVRNHSKFSQLHEFGKTLPAIRARLQKDLSKPGLSFEKVMATIVSLMQCTCIRIGNAMYEKLYGSFGLTTLKDRHVTIQGTKMLFSFKGKKGIFHNITLKSKKLANIVKQCRDIPGQELFQYYDENGERKTVDSGMVNSYIKEISGGNFTAKDFRTWSGTIHALEALEKTEPASTFNSIKRKINEVLDYVAKQLGNTRTVCRKYYVHPLLLEMYTNNTLKKFLKRKATNEHNNNNDLNAEETLLMQILETNKAAIIL